MHSDKASMTWAISIAVAVIGVAVAVAVAFIFTTRATEQGQADAVRACTENGGSWLISQSGDYECSRQ